MDAILSGTAHPFWVRGCERSGRVWGFPWPIRPSTIGSMDETLFDLPWADPPRSAPGPPAGPAHSAPSATRWSCARCTSTGSFRRTTARARRQT